MQVIVTCDSCEKQLTGTSYKRLSLIGKINSPSFCDTNDGPKKYYNFYNLKCLRAWLAKAPKERIRA